ncbi:MAG: ABC transporter permease subunit, partial [Spirochaetales bacterium]|nr:ABC transporter permease subunit [Spirochaetales bacterium]
ALPLVYRTARAAFMQIDPSLVPAARTLGMTERSIFLRVLIPSALPGLLAGTALAFARALGEFGATLMLAGNIPGKTQTIPVAIYFAAESGRNDLALRWVAVVACISLASVAALNACERRMK